MFDVEKTEGSSENRLWASVVLLLIEDAKVVKKAMLRYYESLSLYKDRHDFFFQVTAQEHFLCLDAWENDRKRIIHEASSDWFKEMCEYINLCEIKARNKIMRLACIDEKMIMEMRFWRESFFKAIQDREQDEQVANGGRIKKKKKKDHRPYTV